MGPVCDFPDNVDCTNGYSTTDRNPTGPTIKPTTPITPTASITPTAPTTPTTETTAKPTTIQTTPTEAPGCLTDDDCENDEWCDTSVTPGECKPGCRTSNDCTAMSCSECVNHQCVDPECCTSDDCEAVTDMVCSVCNIDTCSQPECCADDDCPVSNLFVVILSYYLIFLMRVTSVKMRNVFQKENVTPCDPVTVLMESVTFQATTTVSIVIWTPMSVSQV